MQVHTIPPVMFRLYDLLHMQIKTYGAAAVINVFDFYDTACPAGLRGGK